MSTGMTKSELIQSLADEMGTDKKTATAALDALGAIATREVKAGGAMMLPGVGKLFRRDRPEREVRNPATGETMTKAPDSTVKFTVAKALKDSANG